MRKHRARKAVAMIMAVCLLAGCSTSGNFPSLENGNLAVSDEDTVVFRTLYSSEVQDLNYLVSSSSVDTAVSANIVDALVDYDTYGNILPGLAERWSSNDDLTEWTFQIRKGAKWYDFQGNEYADVTADDWVAAAEYVNDAANGSDIQYMYSTGSVVKNAQAYYDYTSYQIDPDSFDEAPAEVAPEDIGVYAKDDYTLVYSLEQPCPFFPSVLSYTTYLPVCRKYLEETGEMFAKSNESLLYNGAYILTNFEPLEKHIFTKNPYYWDKDNVHIDIVENRYDPDAADVGPALYQSDRVDRAVISPDELDEWMENENAAEQIHKTRPDNSFSYFYTFNFEPQFDEEFEPDNWAKAVVNENFRKAMFAGLDRLKALSVYEPDSPEILICNTVTPPDSASANGMDFTEYAPLADITAGDSFDEWQALAYRDRARGELAAAGVTFPIKVLMPYNPATIGLKQESEIVEEQLENLLGKDFIDIIVEKGPETGFLLSVRQSGKYAFMKCRWGADYADPQTWTEPFADDGEYMFWHTCEDARVRKVHDAWQETIGEASAIYDDESARYTKFAEAERLLIDHAIIIPFSIMSGDGYIFSKIDQFEGEYAPYGIANQRYKLFHLNDASMSMEEFDAAYEKWKLERAASLAE